MASAHFPEYTQLYMPETELSFNGKLKGGLLETKISSYDPNLSLMEALLQVLHFQVWHDLRPISSSR